MPPTKLYRLPKKCALRKHLPSDCAYLVDRWLAAEGLSSLLIEFRRKCCFVDQLKKGYSAFHAERHGTAARYKKLKRWTFLYALRDLCARLGVPLLENDPQLPCKSLVTRGERQRARHNLYGLKNTPLRLADALDLAGVTVPRHPTWRDSFELRQPCEQFWMAESYRPGHGREACAKMRKLATGRMETWEARATMRAELEAEQEGRPSAKGGMRAAMAEAP
jgi:hypothetical protein